MPITDALPDMERELKFFSATNDNPQKLTRAQIHQFNVQGYICPLDVFTPEEAAANRRYFDALMVEAQANGHNSYSINGWHRHCRGIYDLLHEPRILDYVEDLLGPNLISVMTHYFCKEPGDQKQVVWHQDASYWPLTPSKVVTAWLAIDDVDEENGPMTVVPGSHVHGQIPFEHSTAEEQNVLGQSVHDPLRWGGEPVPFTMRAGPDVPAHRPALTRLGPQPLHAPPLRPDAALHAARGAHPRGEARPRLYLPWHRSERLLDQPPRADRRRGAPEGLATVSLPEAFRARLQAILPAEHFAACWQSLAAEQPTAFRANAFKGTPDALVAELTAEGFALAPLSWKTDAFVVPTAQRRALTECAAYREGRLYIQNPSSMVPPILLAPQSEECILDLGAAPGSKTLQLAELMGNQGSIWAVESVRGRFFRLRDNLARHGAENVQVHLADGTRIWASPSRALRPRAPRRAVLVRRAIPRRCAQDLCLLEPEENRRGQPQAATALLRGRAMPQAGRSAGLFDLHLRTRRKRGHCQPSAAAIRRCPNRRRHRAAFCQCDSGLERVAREGV